MSHSDMLHNDISSGDVSSNMSHRVRLFKLNHVINLKS